MKKITIMLCFLIGTAAFSQTTEVSKKITPEIIMAANDSLMSLLHLNDSIATVMADSLQVLALAKNKAVIESAESSAFQKLISYILSALMLLLAYLVKMMRNKQFRSELLHRLSCESPEFLKKVQWAAAIVLFISLLCILIDSYFYKFMGVNLQAVCFYMIPICFVSYFVAKLAKKDKSLPSAN